MSVSRKQLIATAEELNLHPDQGGAVGFEPPIDVSLPLKKLATAIAEMINDEKDGLLPKDKLTDETWRVCAELGNNIAIDIVSTRDAEAQAAKIEKRQEKTKAKPMGTPNPIVTTVSPTEKAIAVFVEAIKAGAPYGKTQDAEVAAEVGIGSVQYVGQIRRIVSATVKMMEK